MSLAQTGAVETASSPSETSSIFASLFVHRDAIDRHLKTPLLREREEYLRCLLAKGHKLRWIKERASTLIHVVRLLPIHLGASFNTLQIMQAAVVWSAESPQANASKRESNFGAAARSWFRFLGFFDAARLGGDFADVLVAFTESMERDLGYLPATRQLSGYAVGAFLAWVSSRRLDFSQISSEDVNVYFDEREGGGWSARTSINAAQALTTFFRYAETQNWTQQNLSNTFRGRRPVAKRSSTQCPPWKAIRGLIKTLAASDASQCRAKAILLLASVYGLRRSELVRLTLDDLDWNNAVLTVRRAKRGRTQQFPLQSEVADALICYLTTVRPQTPLREVFLTLHEPYRPARNLGTAMRQVMNAHADFKRPFGLHSLRHACATELLRRGTSLKDIADFLGHRGLKSVSIYAHSNTKALKKVADLDLVGIL